MFQRENFKTLLKRAGEPRKFIQVLLGPRQVGKTTLVEQFLSVWKGVSHYVSADDPSFQTGTWLSQQWDLARLQLNHQQKVLLIVDEVQKIPHWSDVVKKEWDADTRNKKNITLLLLGSAPWLIEKGLTESLAGRFEILRLGHWAYSEMKQAFGWSLDTYLFYGGYPGSASLLPDHERWSRYLFDALIETTLSRDILLLNRVDKPALLRQVFRLACDYSGQILSYQKMIGQFQDAGNVTTLAHYLELLNAACLVGGLPKFSTARYQERGSSPKLQVWNNALMSVFSNYTLKEALLDRDFWGRLVESAVGAHLMNSVRGTTIELSYWREQNLEVDFVLRRGKKITAIEVKSGRVRGHLSGMENFIKKFKPQKTLLIEPRNLEQFFSWDISDLV